MPPISPTLNIGPITIHWYGVLIVLGALAGAYVASLEANASLEAKRRGEDPEIVWNALVWCLIGGILGARLYHILSSPQGTDIGFRYYFFTNPLETVPVLGTYSHHHRAPTLDSDTISSPTPWRQFPCWALPFPSPRR
jgi:prolipoprotein diacylglyceryltransferase